MLQISKKSLVTYKITTKKRKKEFRLKEMLETEKLKTKNWLNIENRIECRETREKTRGKKDFFKHQKCKFN